MLRFWSKGVCYGIGIGGILLTLTLLGGCDLFDTLADLLRLENEAVAQQERRIETIMIDAGTFLILTDSEPKVEVLDGTTRYTQFDDNTSLSYNVGGTPQTVDLDPEDTVIERPGLHAITIIRAQ